MPTETDERLDRIFAALADPIRRGILTRLGEGEATVSELAEPYAVSLPAISRHLKVLAGAGLITRDKRAQWRTNQLRPEPLREASDWVEALTELWQRRFDRLDVHLANQMAALRRAAEQRKDKPQ